MNIRNLPWFGGAGGAPAQTAASAREATSCDAVADDDTHTRTHAKNA